MKTKELLDAVNKVKPGIQEGSILPQSSLVSFNDDILMSWSDEIAVSVPFKSGLKGGLPAKELSELLQKLPEDEVEATQKEKEIIFTCGKMKAGLNIQETEFPVLKIGKDDKWKRLPKDFSEAMQFCLFSVAADISKGVMTCLNAEGNIMVSCDNFRLTTYQMSTKVTDQLLIPYNTIKPLIAHNPNKFLSKDNWIHFKNSENAVFSCRTMDGEYPDISHLLEVKGQKIEFPKKLKEVLARAEVLAEANLNLGSTVMLTLEKGKIICKAENIVGWITEEVKAGYKGAKISFSIDPNLLSQILDRIDTATIGEEKIRFDGGNFVHVIALVSEK